MIQSVSLTLNGKPVKLDVDSDRSLLWVLRTDLGVTGPKYGCGEGLCGACTVLLNRRAVPSCVIPVKEAGNAEIVTIEGLSANGKLHPLQTAFIETGALQCGFCTPGMILKAYGLLLAVPEPTESEIVAEMENHLCRCGSYGRIVQAIHLAAKAMKGGKT
jgi:aerobic-type carbon monoxide dehydrogenase small subunit (CoxS/CutS family)